MSKVHLDESTISIPADLRKYLDDTNYRDGFKHLVDELPKTYSVQDISTNSQAVDIWQTIGLWYFNQQPKRRTFEARSIFFALYHHMLKAQGELDKYIHKGMPLLWIGECFGDVNFSVLRKRYLMLALCEDSIRGQGSISPNDTGVYFRLVWRIGMDDSALQSYAKRCYELFKENQIEGRNPEWILQNLDQEWMTEFPTPAESNLYIAHPVYARMLLNKIGTSSGKALEELAEYLMRCMPGCRVKRRGKTHSTDHDLICSMDGFDIDFRSELGRYFVCECKDWDKPADFSAFAKFCRVLDSVKSKFGILFSSKGISGEGKALYADREQLKVFQDRGIVIVVINLSDLERAIDGENFISMLRNKYEEVRLDLLNLTDS